MARRIVVLLIAVLGVALIAGSVGKRPSAAARQPATPDRLVLHEWGTFTGLAASDGTHLPFNVNVGWDLPGFVDNRQKFAIAQDPKLEMTLMFLKAGGIAALQRMETPIVYFYADRPMDVNLRVDFPQGSLTEFYPPVQAISPQFGEGIGEPRVGRPTTGPATQPGVAAAPPASFLDWGRLHLVPRPAGADGKLIPTVDVKEKYGFARATDSAIVQTSSMNGRPHEEKFLFYRGVGNFTLPVTFAALGSDRYEVRNSGSDPISIAVLLRTEPGATGPGRYAFLWNVRGKQQIDLPLADESGDTIESKITRLLVAEGLYEKEARAMVATWKANWLGEPGTRLLYIVPRKTTDRLLPLQVTPTPTETVRVLVGRIDSTSPEFEDRLQGMITRAVALGQYGITEAETRELQRLDRFLYPVLDRAAKVRGTPDARNGVNKLITAMNARTAPTK